MGGLRAAKKRATRKAILDAAMDLFAKNGYEQTSIGQLARTAGIGKGTIYGYFRTKQEIFLVFCEEEIDHVFTALAKREDPAAPLLDQLATLFTSQFRFLTRNREFGRILVREMAFPSPAASDIARELGDRYLAALGEILARAAGHGEIRPGFDSFLAAGHLYGLYLVTLSGWYSGYLKSDDEVDGTLRGLLRQALEGMQPTPADDPADKG